jgi:hypothetical protein
MLSSFVEAVMSADADAVCGADYGERSKQRTNTRNGYRRRDWDTRAGTIELAIPKLRSGSYFPEWLLQVNQPTSAIEVAGQPVLRQKGREDDLVNELKLLIVASEGAGMSLMDLRRTWGGASSARLGSTRHWTAFEATQPSGNRTSCATWRAGPPSCAQCSASRPSCPRGRRCRTGRSIRRRPSAP